MHFHFRLARAGEMNCRMKLLNDRIMDCSFEMGRGERKPGGEEKER